MKGAKKQVGEGIGQVRLKTIDDLRQLAEKLDVPIDVSEDVSVLAEPVRIGGLEVPNSLAVHPMEGCDGDSLGRLGELTLRRYRRFAAGGAGLIWVEATAVVAEGRANPRQLWLNADSKESFAAMVRMIREVAAESMGAGHRPFLVLQLTHSGRYSKPEGLRRAMIAQRNPHKDNFAHADEWAIVSDEYLDRLVDAYVEAARMAFEVGFDAVDIKSCHGYLISELLGCYNREGKYGGSFENRTRFLLDVVAKIGAELGEDKQVVTRLGVYDAVAYPYGWGVDRDDCTKPDLTEPKKLVGLLVEKGVKMINVSIADPYFNPHYGRPYDEPVKGGYESPEHPLVGVSRLIELAGEIQKQFSDVAIVGTGYTWLRTLMPYVAAASKANGLATIIGGGRLAVAYPDFAKDIIQKGRLESNKVCIGCSACSQIMKDGGMTGCVVRDKEIYRPIYEQVRKGKETQT